MSLATPFLAAVMMLSPLNAEAFQEEGIRLVGRSPSSRALSAVTLRCGENTLIVSIQNLPSESPKFAQVTKNGQAIDRRELRQLELQLSRSSVAYVGKASCLKDAATFQVVGSLLETKGAEDDDYSISLRLRM